MAANSGLPIKGRRADWLTKLVWKRAQQLAVLYPQDMLLDIACGDGELLRRIGQNEPQVGLAGICSTPMLARIARNRVPDADIMYAELDDFPWLNQSFDVVLCLLSVPAMRELRTTLAQVFRVLKPGGQFLFATPWMPFPFRALANRLLVDDSDDSAAMLSTQELSAALVEAGFLYVSQLHFVGLRRISICWKP